MKILIHGINFAPDLIGIAKYTGEMAGWLAAQGHAVRVVTAPPYYPAWRVADGYGAGRYQRETWHWDSGASADADAAAPCPSYNSRPMKEMRLLRIHGKVQGVGYRFFATRVARRLGLKGWITNTRDGSVEAAVEGEKSAIDEWIEELKEGPRYAEVTNIEQETKDYSGRLPDFDVKF